MVQASCGAGLDYGGIIGGDEETVPTTLDSRFFLYF